MSQRQHDGTIPLQNTHPAEVPENDASTGYIRIIRTMAYVTADYCCRERQSHISSNALRLIKLRHYYAGDAEIDRL